MLLELLEDQLDLPPEAVELGDCLAAPGGVYVGQVVVRGADGSALFSAPRASTPRTNHQPHGEQGAMFSAARDPDADIEIPRAFDARSAAQKLSEANAIGRLLNELPDPLRAPSDFVHDRVAVDAHRRDELQVCVAELFQLSSGSVGVVEQQERAGTKQGSVWKQTRIVDFSARQARRQRNEPENRQSEGRLQLGWRAHKSGEKSSKAIVKLDNRRVDCDDVREMPSQWMLDPSVAAPLLHSRLEGSRHQLNRRRRFESHLEGTRPNALTAHPLKNLSGLVKPGHSGCKSAQDDRPDEIRGPDGTH